MGFVRFDRKNEAENAIEQVNGTSPFPGGTDPIQVKFANSPVSSVQKAVALQVIFYILIYSIIFWGGGIFVFGQYRSFSIGKKLWDYFCVEILNLVA